MMHFRTSDTFTRSPHRPRVRAGVCREHNGYAAYLNSRPVARVDAWPHRSIADARALARRIHRDPIARKLVKVLRVDGVSFTLSPPVALFMEVARPEYLR